MADDVRIYVTGLKELRHALAVLEPELVPEFRKELKAVGETVAARVRAQMPSKSGAARSSVRITSGGNTLYLIGGNAKAPYYGWLDFGGTLAAVGNRTNEQHRPVFKAGRYIYPTLERSNTIIVEGAARAFDHTTRKLGFT